MRKIQRVFVLAAIALGLTTSGSMAQSLTLADRIEEDWVMVVDGTAPSNGPQANTVMGPSADLSQPVVVLDINYRHVPTYQPGGLQVLVYGNNGITSTNVLTTNALNLNNSTVSWTQRMSISGGTIQYVLANVSSATWGSFTNNAVLAYFATSNLTFTGYDPNASVANSGGPWKTQGLTSLSLVRVRYYQGNTLIGTDSTTRQVDCTKPFNHP